MYDVKTKLFKHDNKIETRDTHSTCLTVTLKHERLPVPSAVNGYNDAARFEGCPKAATRAGYCGVHRAESNRCPDCPVTVAEEPNPKRVKLDA